MSDYNREYRSRNREHFTEYDRKWTAANRDAAKDRSRKWREENPEHKKANDKEYYRKNQERELQKSKKRHQQNKETNCNRSKEWRKTNRGRVLAQTAKRRAKKKQAIPRWADMKQIDFLYSQAVRLTEETGVSHQVDHTIPLNSDVVCGLHCEDNLRVITAEENNAKKNKLIEE